MHLKTLLCAFAFLAASIVQAADTGIISGSVSNTATGNLLEGARLELPQLGLTALTDETGRFVLNNVPAGTHDIVASYIGLDRLSAQVTAVSYTHLTLPTILRV